MSEQIQEPQGEVKEQVVSAAKQLKPEKVVKASKPKVAKTKAKSKEKVQPIGKTCTKCKKNKTKTPRARFCWPCYKERRKLQLKRNNVTWQARVQKGKAGHHLTYRNKPTAFSAEHKDQALKLAKKYKDEERIEHTKKVLAKFKHVAK